MRVIFADAFYYLALLNPRDSAHARAVAIGPTLSGRLVTTSYVLTEVADAFELLEFAILPPLGLDRRVSLSVPLATGTIATTSVTIPPLQ